MKNFLCCKISRCLARKMPLKIGAALAFVVLLSALGLRPAPAQTVESATTGRAFLWVGGGVSGYTLEYGDRKNAGLTAFVDADSTRRLGIEAEARWLDFHQTANVHAETYLAGPRYHVNAGPFQPYVKALIGDGEFNFAYNYAHGSYFVIAPGGGLDYRLRPRVNIRIFDFEYQYWPQFTFGTMSSAGVTSGIRLRVF